jgi:hypothetical protein
MHGTNLHSTRRVLIEALWALLVCLRALNLPYFRPVPGAGVVLEDVGAVSFSSSHYREVGLKKSWWGSLPCLLSGAEYIMSLMLTA